MPVATVYETDYGTVVLGDGREASALGLTHSERLARTDKLAERAWKAGLNVDGLPEEALWLFNHDIDSEYDNG